MRQFYKFALSAITAMLVSYSASAQCPAFDITAGATEVSGSDFVCDGTNVTVQWNDVPGATGYRLRVGNNANYDNLDVSYVVDGGGAGPFQSTFSVPAATNGTFYTYTVDYSMDGGFSLGTAAGAVYTDCSVNAATFKVSVDPVDPTAASITDGGDGGNSVCAGNTFEVTGDGSPGDLGEYYWRYDGGAWNAAGTNSAFNVDASIANGFTAAGFAEFDVAVSDNICGVNDPISDSVVFNLELRNVFQITGVVADGSAITEGDKVCYDNSNTQTFDVSFTDVLGAGSNGDLNFSTDSGATFTPNGAAGASAQSYTYTTDDTDYAFFINAAGFCAAPADTFFASTYDNVGAEPVNVEIEFSLDGGTSYQPWASGAVNVCDGQVLTVRVNTTEDGNPGDNPATTVQFQVDQNQDGFETFSTPSAIGAGGEFTYSTPAAVAGVNNWLRVAYIDACTGITHVSVPSVLYLPYNGVSNSSAGTTSGLTITREDNVTGLTSGNKVCSGESLDIDVVIGDGTIGSNGELRVYKITATDTTLVGNGVSPLNIGDHVHGAVAATYHAVIYSDCDSIPVANTPAILANVHVASGSLDSVRVSEFAINEDDLACTGEGITLQAYPSTVGDDNPVVTFYHNANPTLDGGETMIGLGALNIGNGSYDLATNHVNMDVYYIAQITSDCSANSEAPTQLIGTHTASVDPTDFDISAVAFAADDLDSDDNNNVDFAEGICAGTTVYFDLTDGTLGNDSSMYFWEIDTTSNGAGTGYVGLDTNMTGQVSVAINDNNALVRVRIAGGDCGYTGAYLVSSITVLDATDTPTLSSYVERDGVKGDVTIMLNDEFCSGNDLVINYTTGANITTDDNPVVYYKENGAGTLGSTAIGGFAASTTYEFVIGTGSLTEGNTYQLFFDTDCISEVAVSGVFTVDYKEENANAAALLDTNTTTPVLTGDFVCENNGVMISLHNPATLGDVDNYTNTPEFVFEMNVDGGGWIEVARGNGANDSIYTVDVDAVIIGNGGFGNVNEIDVRSYIDGGCDPTGMTATFTINIFNATAGFTTISLNNDNYCANESASILVDLVANGATVGADNFTRIVWYAMDDQGLPVTKIKETTLTNAAAITDGSRLRFNTDALPLLASNDAPDTTTTIGVRIESCDTSAFEVRTITVKDLPQNQSAAGTPSVVSASPSSVCSGSSSTLSIINYITGTNGQVTWYDDAVATNLLATGPSFTPSSITSDTTFYVRIEADCDTTPMLSVTVTLSTIDPTDVLSISVPAYICEGGSFVAEAIGSVGDGSYIWEVSFDGVVFSSISDGSPGDKFLSYSANNLNYTGNTANVTLRASRTNGCITTDPSPSETSFEVRQNPDRLTSMQSTDTEVCVNEAPVDFVVSGGNAGYDGQIQWNIVKTGGADSVVTQWANMSSVSFDWANFDGSGEYTLYAQYVSGSCGTYAEDSVSSVINIYELPVNDYPNASNDTIVCSNDTLDLNGLSGYANYSFSGPGVIAGNLYVAAQGSFANSEVGGVESLTYTVTENGCTSVFTVEVVVNGTAKITAATTTDASCNATDGTAKVTVISGGSAPFDFSTDAMSFGFAADSTITGLAGGAHNLYVRDANGCISSAFGVTVASSTGFSVVGNVESEITCNGDEDGEFSVAVTGGLAPYDYTVTLDGNPFASGTDVTSNSYTFANLAPGAYVATFVDDAGCSLSYSYTFVEPSEIGLTVTDFQEVDCFGEATGVIGGLVATSTHGGPFEYKLNDGDFETVTGFSGLVAGDYLITVRDTNLCERTFLFSINEPTALEIDTNVVDFDENGYDIELDANGGTPSYTYSKGGSFQTSNLFEDIAPGTHTFTVKDANGCETDITVFLAPVGIKENVGIFAGAVANPNPFSNEFTISGITQGVEITITDVYGKRVDFVSLIKDSKATITTGNLATGVYFTTVRKGNSVATFRMLKD